MAAATTRRTAAKKTAAKAKPAPAPEVVEEELDDLETEEGDEDELEADEDMDELEEDEVADSKPTASKKKAAGDDITFGIQDLIALVKKETGDVTDGRALRTLIRKMAREDNARVNRTITPGNRTRYNWTGPNDPEVVAIIAAYKGGELEAEKKAKLDALKAQKAAKTAAKKAEATEAEGDDEAPAPKRTAKKTATRRKAAPVGEQVEDDEELSFDDEDGDE